VDTQLKKGVLEMCILFQLAKGDMYGYEVMKKIKDVFPDVYDGSIYAILRRLHAQGCAETFMRESCGGPPRKYYRITGQGREYLDRSLSEWQALVGGVGKLGVNPYLNL
jgi:PadR family transcriptional regulator PadR